jgi:hypothetical protein
MKTRLTWLLWTGLAVAACGGGDGDSEDSGDASGTAGDETGEPLTSVPFDDFYALAEEAFCHWQVACHQYGVEARCTSVNHIEVRLSMQRISGAGNSDSVPIDYMREAIEVGRIGYDKKAAATCLEYVRARTCEHEQLHAATEEEIAGKAACAAVFTGRMGRNGPCLAASECAEAAICGFDPTCTDACCVGACRVLAAPIEIGQPCPNGSGCVADSYCDFDPNTGMATTCKAAPGLGKSCPQGTCSGGAVCDYTGDQPLCVAPKPPGKRCYNDNECAQPGVCRYNPDVGDSVCFKPSDEGGPCQFDNGGLQCLRFDNACSANNKCELLPGKSGGCAQAGQCAGDFFCSESQGYQCTPVADEGEGCGYQESAEFFEYIPCSGDHYCDNEFDTGKCIAPTGAASCPVPDDPVPAG